MFIKNKSVIFASYAVWFPVIAVIVMEILNTMLEINMISETMYPVVMLITGFLGRAVVQHKNSQ